MAWATTTSTILACSVAGRRWKPNLTGVFSKRCSTVTTVPLAIPNGSISALLPSSIWILRPSCPSGLEATVSLETIPILARASPLNPSV